MLLSVSISLAHTSCDSDFSIEPTNNQQIPEIKNLSKGYAINNNECLINIDSATFSRTDSLITPSRSELTGKPLSSIEFDVIAVKGYGYDVKTKVSTKTYVFSTEMLKRLGLPNGYYPATVYKIEKKLFCRNGSLIVPKDIEDTSKGSIFIGTKDDKVFTQDPIRFGFRTEEVKDNGDGFFWATTYIAYIHSNQLGQEVNHYYPCPETDLVWEYEDYNAMSNNIR